MTHGVRAVHAGRLEPSWVLYVTFEATRENPSGFVSPLATAFMKAIEARLERHARDCMQMCASTGTQGLAELHRQHYADAAGVAQRLELAMLHHWRAFRDLFPQATKEQYLRATLTPTVDATRALMFQHLLSLDDDAIQSALKACGREREPVILGYDEIGQLLLPQHRKYVPAHWFQSAGTGSPPSLSPTGALENGRPLLAPFIVGLLECHQWNGFRRGTERACTVRGMCRRE